MSAASRVAARHLANHPVIDLDWIARARKGWKSLVEKSLAGMDHPEVAEHLERIIGWLDDFAEDILFGKGFWVQMGPSPSLSILGRAKSKIVAMLHETRTLVADCRSTILSAALQMDVGSPEYQLDGGHLRRFMEERDPRSPMRAYAADARARAGETLERADALFSRRLLRAITSFVTEYGQDGTTGDLLERYDREVTLGRVKVLFQDLPYRRGPLDTTVPRGTNPLRDPYDARRYLRYLERARALLEKNGFGHLWYGHISIQAVDAGGQNPYGPSFGVGGDYNPSTDLIRVFVDPQAFVTDLVLHEMGHRYYYRFMDKADRARFDDYFAGRVQPDVLRRLADEVLLWLGDVEQGAAGPDPNEVREIRRILTRPAVRPDVLSDLGRVYGRDMPDALRTSLETSLGHGVPATSTYGQQSTEEDFAEVFSAYCLGHGLTADQRGRFQAFRGRMQRHGRRQ